MKISSKLNELKPTDLNCNVFDVYSYDGLSMQDLLCQFFTKINECIKVSNETIDLASWLVNEGLEQEVVEKLVLWLNDGTLENLINVNLFNTLHTKIENINSQLEDIAYNPLIFKTESNTWTDAFQTAINKLKNGDTLLIPSGDFKVQTLYFNNLENIRVTSSFGKLIKEIGDINLIELNNCKNIVFENIILDGNNQIGSKKNGSSYGVDKNLVSVKNTIGTCKNIQFINTQFIDAQNRAIAIEPSGSTVPSDGIVGLYVYKCSFVNIYNMAISINVGENIIVKDCYFEKVKNTSIQFGGLTNLCEIADCVIIEGNQNAIGCNSSKLKIRNNKILGIIHDGNYPEEYSIFTYKRNNSSGNYVEIEGNVIENNTSLGGILVKGGLFITILRNKIVNVNNGAGIYVKYADHDPNDEVYLQYSKNIIISENTIENTKGQGILVYNSERVVTENNIICDVYSEAIKYDNCTGIISSNYIEKNNSTMVGISSINSPHIILGNNKSKGVKLYSGDAIKYNMTYARSKSGSVTIPKGNTSVTLTHSLGNYPSSIIATVRDKDINVYVSGISVDTAVINIKEAQTSDTIVYYVCNAELGY